MKLGGMIPVPLIINLEDEVLVDAMQKLHGILLTGGAAGMFFVKPDTNDKPHMYLRKVQMI